MEKLDAVVERLEISGVSINPEETCRHGLLSYWLAVTSTDNFVT